MKIILLYTRIQALENNSVIPSKECLELRALNLSFQLKIWNQATKPIMTVPDPTTHGWKDVDGTLEMIPDSKENQDKQASVYETVMKKCKCKKSQCKNGKCGCFNSKQNCSSFCECENCGNPHSTESKKKNDEDQLDSETDEENLYARLDWAPLTSMGSCRHLCAQAAKPQDEFCSSLNFYFHEPEPQRLCQLRVPPPYIFLRNIWSTADDAG